MKFQGDSGRRGKKTNYIKHADTRDRSNRPKQVWLKSNTGDLIQSDLSNVAAQKGEKAAVAIRVYH